jgi:hypothetical protein
LFFWREGFGALSLPSGGIFSLDCCDSVWKTGWSVSIFMRNSWDSSFGIPILNLRWLNLINLSSEFAYRLLTTLC